MRSLLPLSLLLLLLPTPPQQDATTTLHVDTKLTVVNVTVTDKAGNPVHGLKPSDFVIKEDGKPQSIRNFDEVGTAPPTLSIAPKLPPGVYSNISTPPPAQGPVNILLFSQLGSREDMYYARYQALEYLKSLPTGTRVAVLVIENSVFMVQNITSDRNILIAAVNSIHYQEVGGVTFHDPKSLARVCVQANEQSHRTIDGLRQIAATFASVPGRKNLIWFTHGSPWLTNPSYFRALFRDLNICLDDDTQQLQAAYGMLSASQVAISTIDSHGLEGYSENPSAAFFNRQLNQESIRDFAEATGGTAYYNRNDLDAMIGQSIATNSDYYSIAYTPPLAGYDGKYHTISVKVDRPGIQLSYRKGYTSLDLANVNTTIARHNKTADTGDSTLQASIVPAIEQFHEQMSHGADPAAGLPFVASITPTATPAKPAPLPIKGDLNPKVKAHSLIRYDVVYALPPGEITLNQNPDGTRNASVEFDIVAYGEDGTPLNTLRQTANVTLKPHDVADFQQKSFKVPFQLDLPPGKLFLRVGALDVLSGKSGTLEVPQTVAKP